MKNYVKKLILLLLILFSYGSSKGQYSLTAQEIKNIRLAYDSLDECKEVSDSLRSQINNALQVIQISDTVINSLHQINFNQGEIIRGKDILIRDERQLSSSLRNKYRLWKLAAIILAGVNVYQVVNGK